MLGKDIDYLETIVADSKPVTLNKLKTLYYFLVFVTLISCLLLLIEKFMKTNNNTPDRQEQTWVIANTEIKYIDAYLKLTN